MTDLTHDVPVAYQGILPDLFKEGKGAVVQGKFDADGLFKATEVLAKHDENYMPPAAQHALDQAQRAKDAAKP
jgi:cytochrome c-type biogenesis protein CcmE